MENKKITLHINNMAYELVLDDDMQKEITRHFDLSKNNETFTLLKAYLTTLKEKRELKLKFEKEITNISNKLVGF
ncbi:hypothetical protein CRU94_04065 [Arcobacter sp. AHV-9/2010]|uniref:hypothetical protein n=1 Tax=Arcobacter sp. AHV-9/2010 TaxID=2021861 RepID=UPI00100A98C7|nr:hypothetical protein [Arcobacter sp. CECT 9299]RXJ95798.1 hypothetical protein CRU94_04065 [Arcobacter sp. CECT 9299]